MNTTTKHSLKCAGILVIIAIICVAIPVIIKQILPVYTSKLDIETVAVLNKLVQSDLSDEAAFEEGYFSIVDFNLDAFNSDNREHAEDRVLDAFHVESKGQYIFRTQTVGYSKQISVFWIAYDANGKIIAFDVESTGKDYFLSNSTSLDRLKAEIIGKSVLTKDEVTKLHASPSGAPGKSIDGIVKNLKLTFACYEAVSAGGGN